MRLFEFGGVDYTRFIKVPTYQVNLKPEYTAWTDGNGKDHHDITRFRVAGSFELFFDDKDSELSFFAALNNASGSVGYLHGLECKLYALNTNTVYPVSVYFEINPKNELPLLGRANHGGIVMKVSER